MVNLNASLFAVLAIFWVTMLVLKKLYFEPYRRVMEEREKYLQERRKRTSRAIEEYEKKLALLEKKLDEARKEAALIREEIVKKAEEEREKLLTATKEQVHRLIEQAKANMEKQSLEARNWIEQNAERIAEEIKRRLFSAA